MGISKEIWEEDIAHKTPLDKLANSIFSFNCKNTYINLEYWYRNGRLHMVVLQGIVFLAKASSPSTVRVTSLSSLFWRLVKPMTILSAPGHQIRKEATSRRSKKLLLPRSQTAGNNQMCTGCASKLLKRSRKELIWVCPMNDELPSPWWLT